MHPRDRISKIIREAEGIIRDVESWNDNRPDAEPLDCEVERVILAMAYPCLEAFDRGDDLEAKRLAEELHEYGRRVGRGIK